MVSVRQHRPRMIEEVEALEKEHRELIATCVEIEWFVDDASNPDENAVRTLREKTARLLARLAQHEEVENRLVQEAFVDDLGAGG